MKSTDDLLKEAQSRKGDSSGRLKQYEKSRNAYFGEQDGGPQATGMDSAGRSLLTLRADLGERRGGPNLLLPIVDDYTYLRGSIPVFKVLPEGEGDDDKQESIKRTRILRAQWQNSSMEVQQLEAAWYITCLGDCLYTLTPLFPNDAKDPFQPPGVYISVHDPATAFPRFRTGWQRHELDDLYVIEEISKDQAKSQYTVETTKPKVERIHYLSSEESVLLVDGVEVVRVEHKLGFCPAQWVFNKMVGGKHAQSDISAVIEQHQELQMMFHVATDGIMEATYSQLVVKDPVNVNQQFEIGPGAAPIVVQGTGDVHRLQPSTPSPAVDSLIQRHWENIQHQTGSAPVRTEQRIGGSNISARAINAVQGPMETRLMGLQTLMGTALRSLNAKLLLMLYKLPEFSSTDISIWGQEQGKPVQTTFKGKDLKGWFRTSVEYGAMIGSTTHEKAVMGLQLMGQQLVPGEWVLEQVGVDDPETLIKEAEAQQSRRMQQQMQMQQPPAPGGPPPGGPPGGQDPAAQQAQIMQPAEQGQSLAGGSTQPQNDSSSPAGQPGGAPPPPGLPNFPELPHAPDAPPAQPGAIADVSDAIQSALEQARQQMQGTVLSADPQPGGVIRLRITDTHDKPILRKAFAAQNLRVSFDHVSDTRYAT